jgi:hypothetical protein
MNEIVTSYTVGITIQYTGIVYKNVPQIHKKIFLITWQQCKKYIVTFNDDALQLCYVIHFMTNRVMGHHV